MPSINSFALKTFGCKVNQYDSQLLADALSALGLRRVPGRAIDRSPEEDPGLVVVNTCAVTVRSEAKARRFIRSLLRKRPEATVLATGCAVRRDPDQWAALGCGDGSRLLTAPDLPQVARTLADAGLLPDEATTTADLPSRISTFAGHDRAFVKVQDGCQSFCSYCIVPFVRPGLWSKPAADVVDEVAHLSQAGYGEVVLVGVHLGLYGSEGGECRLAPLLRRLLDETDVGRLRLSSIEPQEVSDELIELAAGSARVCPHFHLPLQSGDDRILQAMNRRYTVRDYLSTLERIARRVPRPSFTTDLLVGFPDEGEEEFAHSLQVCRRAGFSRIHVFHFSPRPGTRAATLPGRPRHHLVARREHELLTLAEDLAQSYRRQFVGESVEVVLESRRDRATGMRQGVTERYLRMRFPCRPESCASEVRPGTLVTVRVSGVDGVGLLGTCEPSPRPTPQLPA